MEVSAGCKHLQTIMHGTEAFYTQAFASSIFLCFLRRHVSVFCVHSVDTVPCMPIISCVDMPLASKTMVNKNNSALQLSIERFEQHQHSLPASIQNNIWDNDLHASLPLLSYHFLIFYLFLRLVVILFHKCVEHVLHV